MQSGQYPEFLHHALVANVDQRSERWRGAAATAAHGLVAPPARIRALYIEGQFCSPSRARLNYSASAIAPYGLSLYYLRFL